MSSVSNKISVEDIQRVALLPYQAHRQLTIREAETITLEILTLLCDRPVKDETTLKYLTRFITPDVYVDLMDERNLNKLCGYPLCSNAPERERGPFEMTPETKKFMWENNPYAYLSRFCSKLHFRCSQFYQVQLSDDAFFSRTGVHLIKDSMADSTHVDKYSIRLLEELLRDKATDDEIKNIAIGIKQLEIKGDDPNRDITAEDEISKWLHDIKIVENDKPSLIGDFAKEDKEEDDLSRII